MADPPSSERLGAYRLIERLGQGGMAVVYRGERAGDAGFRKRVAIKRMLPQYRRDPALLERFAAEARTNARLDHPNLVHVIDFGIDPEPYLVLEFVDGVTLGAILLRLSERNDKLDLATAMHIGAEIAAGLDHAHHKKDDDGTPLGIVHRDVSPQNVLVSHEGTVKVSDFGLVKAADNVLQTSSGVSIGKISYMAPEQAEGREVDARADIFSLGVTLWEMLTVRSLIPPDDPEEAARMLKAGNFPKPSAYTPSVPPELDNIVMGCLEVDPERRTPSAQQVSQGLRELLHARSAGYGREQLARFVHWLFPEHGWALPAPERPAAQPSLEERASRMPVTPATVAAARVVRAEVTPDVPATRASSVPPPATQARVPWAAITISALFGAGATLALVALAFGMYYVARVRSRDANVIASPAPVLVPTSPSVRFESATPEVRIFLGPREIGRTPVELHPHDLTGEPLVAVAPNHQPIILRAERLLELSRAVGRVYPLELEPSHRPDWVAYVRFDGQGTALTPAGRTLGPVPGVIRIPTQRDQPDPERILIFDDLGQTRVELRLSECNAEAVCLLFAGSAN